MILVVGNPRHRTSAAMQALSLMGLTVHGDFTPSAINARGHGECPESHYGVDSSKYGPRDAMKVFAGPFLFKSQISPDDRVIYCLRTPAGVAESQGKAGIWNAGNDLRRFNYWRMVTQFRNWMNDTKTPVFVLDTDDMIKRPTEWMWAMGGFVGVSDVSAAVVNIAPELTRDPPTEVEDKAHRIYQDMKARCIAIT